MKIEIIASIDGYLKENIKKELSKKYYRFLKRQEAHFYVNNEEVNTAHNVKSGDKIIISFNDFTQKDEILYDHPLDILYMNDDFMVVNKESGLNTIPSKSEPVKSLYNAVYTYLKKLGRLETIHIITRLDKDTSGLVLIALNKKAALIMNKNHYEMNKLYYAKVKGELESHFIVEKPIKRVKNSTLREVNPSGQYAKSEFFNEGYKNGYTIIKVKLYTGRTHQIRVHLKSIGYPIINDKLYGHGDGNLGLHACFLSFTFNNKTWTFESNPEWLDN